MIRSATIWLQKIRELQLPDEKIKIMNVCGGHERTISMAGLRKALPDCIELIPGPGCPVCVCPEEDVYDAIQLALHRDITLVAFGDMLRVPVNLPRREVRSLEQARAAGADIRPIASPQEAVDIAHRQPDKQIVFFAAGFETTTAPVAAMLKQGAPTNLALLLSGRRTWPAVKMLLDSEDPGFDALIAPGHVSAVWGPEEWAQVPDGYGLPAAVAGFTAESMLAAIYSTLRQSLEGTAFLDNVYPEVVRPGGNPTARRCIEQTTFIDAAKWRGIGIIPQSGFCLRQEYQDHDARVRFPIADSAQRKRAGEMPQGCDCARVVLGKLYPSDCKVYGIACTPRTPVGPCMVSDEGACRIWWTAGLRPGAERISECTDAAPTTALAR